MMSLKRNLRRSVFTFLFAPVQQVGTKAGTSSEDQQECSFPVDWGAGGAIAGYIRTPGTGSTATASTWWCWWWIIGRK